MLHNSGSLADRGTFPNRGDAARRSNFAGLLRALFTPAARSVAADPLSDHLLQDIGVSHADLQALVL